MDEDVRRGTDVTAGFTGVSRLVWGDNFREICSGDL